MKVFFVEKVPSSLFFCGAECTRKKKDTKKKGKKEEKDERGGEKKRERSPIDPFLVLF